MTLDAMDWVWKHSQSKGNPRIALLAVADAVRTPACEVRLGYSDFTAALNTSRSVCKAAVAKALESGELELVEAGIGTRPSLYRLPKAVGYVRASTASGPESGPLRDQGHELSGPDSGPLRISSGPDSGPLRNEGRTASGPESGPLSTASGPESGPHLPTTPSLQEREVPQQSDSGRYPEDVLPLVHAMTASGLSVRWPWEGTQWFPIIALIRRCGVRPMVEHAHRSAAAARQPVGSAKYFLQGWKELPPAPPENTPDYRPQPHLRVAGRGYQSPEERGIF